MPLIRFSKIAFEWSRLYAAIVTESMHGRIPSKMEIFLDQGDTPIGQKATEFVDFEDIQKLWKRVVSEKRLTVFKAENPIAIDMSTVSSIVRDGEKQKAAITFCLGGERSGTLELDPNTAYVILQFIGEAEAAGG
jgi:hypothetical protein